MNRSKEAIKNYLLGKTIGRGTFSKVKLCQHIPTKQKVAIKMVQKSKFRLNPKSKAHLERELKILKKINHPNVIKLFEVIETEHKIWIITEFASGGELFDYIIAHGKLREDQARKFFRQIVDGVDFCHKMNIIHRDIKPENLLLDSSMNVKIIDFGFSAVVDQDQLCKTSCGSPSYSAPELIQNKEYNGPKADIWSMGVVLYCLLCGKLPFYGPNEKRICEKIIDGKFKIPSHLSPGSVNLIMNILQTNPIKRYSMENIRCDPWFNEGFDGPPLRRQLSTSTELGEVDPIIVETMKGLHISHEEIIASLKSGSFNSIMATYRILRDKMEKESKHYSIQKVEQDSFEPLIGFRRLKNLDFQDSIDNKDEPRPKKRTFLFKTERKKRRENENIVDQPKKTQNNFDHDSAILNLNGMNIRDSHTMQSTNLSPLKWGNPIDNIDQIEDTNEFSFLDNITEKFGQNNRFGNINHWDSSNSNTHQKAANNFIQNSQYLDEPKKPKLTNDSMVKLADLLSDKPLISQDSNSQETSLNHSILETQDRYKSRFDMIFEGRNQNENENENQNQNENQNFFSFKNLLSKNSNKILFDDILRPRSSTANELLTPNKISFDEPLKKITQEPIRKPRAVTSLTNGKGEQEDEYESEKRKEDQANETKKEMETDEILKDTRLPLLVSSTSTKNPKKLFSQCKNVLKKNNISFHDIGVFSVHCSTQSGIEFEIKITRSQKVKKIQVITFTRISGDFWSFREIWDKIIKQMKM